MELTGANPDAIRMGNLLPWRLRRAWQPAALSGGMFALHHHFWQSRALRWVRMGWGNEGWSADTAYLEAVCNWAGQVKGPILECGSGLTTLLLGLIAGDQVTTLEHLPKWKNRVQQTAAKYSVPVNLFTAPLVDYGGFHWYSLPPLLPAGFELVICDGPPSATVGGRYGLLPVAGSLLAQNAVILMDDVERSDEQAIIARWKREFGVRSEEHATSEGAYAVVRLAKLPKSA
jgi:Methyltransferase domain